MEQNSFKELIIFLLKPDLSDILAIPLCQKLLHNSAFVWLNFYINKLWIHVLDNKGDGLDASCYILWLPCSYAMIDYTNTKQ